MAKLRVRVQPGAKRDAVLGFQEGVLRVKLAAPPVEGRANKALIAFFADLLDVPKSNVSITAGFSSREKTVEVAGIGQDEALSRLRASAGQ